MVLFYLAFYECTFHHTLGPGYEEHTPSRRVQGTCPHTRVHTRVWVWVWNIQVHIIYMNEVMKKKKYIAYIRAILYILYTILVYI